MFRSLFATAALALAVLESASAGTRPAALIDAFAHALGATRRVEGRLTGVLRHQPFGSPSATGPVRLGDLDDAALALYTAVHRSLDSVRSPQNLQAVAEAELLVGKTGEAIALLDECLGRAGCSPDAWSDLSAAYLLQSDEDRESIAEEQVAKAIDAAVRATSVEPDRSVPWFNLALAQTRLHLNAATESWTQFLRLESAESWKAEAAARKASLEDRPAQRWSRFLARVQGGASDDDADRVGMVEEFPEQSREWLMEALLPDWGRAVLAGRMNQADVVLARAGAWARALEPVGDDRLLGACVQRLERVSKAGDRRGIDELASAHVAYGEGRRLYELNRRDEARTQFLEASTQFDLGHSPCRGWSDLGVAQAEYLAQRLDQAFTQLQAIAEVARAGHAWSLLGRVQWTAGLVLVDQSHIDAALRCFDDALEVYARVDEDENEAAVAGAAADALRRIGEHRSGWRFLGAALRRLDRVTSVRRRYVLLLNASLFASDGDLPWAAIAFQDASIGAANERGVANTIVEGLVRRARLYLQVDQSGRASADLEAASTVLPHIASKSSLEYERAWLTRVRAELSAVPNPAESLRLIDDPLIAYFEGREPDQVPALWLSRGRAALGAGQPAEADASFRHGVRAFERQWSGLATNEYRVSYLDEAWDLFDELIRIHAIREARPSVALAYAEAARGQETGIGLDVDPTDSERRQAARVIPAGVQVLYYVSLTDKLLAWRLGADDQQFAILDISQVALARQVAAYRQAVMVADSPSAIQAIGGALYRQLVAPVLSGQPPQAQLVIVPDGALYAMPFGSLVDPATGRFLFQDHSVVMAPSLTLYQRAQAQLSHLTRRAITETLLVGAAVNPDPLLASLPGAAEELADVAASYQTPIVLSGTHATPDEFQRLAPGAQVIHFAGHAKANLAFPWASSLVLSPDIHHPSGMLTARELAGWNLSGARLAVLGACQTAYGSLFRGQGLISLARPFLDLGVPSVVGALWDIDDRTTRTFFVAFHRIYVTTGDAGSALREAQKALLTSPDPTLRLPRNWSAFVAFGASGAIPQRN